MKTIWKRKVHAYPDLIPHFRDSVHNFSFVSVILGTGLMFFSFITLKCISSLSGFLGDFYQKGYWTLSKTLSVSVDTVVSFCPYMYLWTSVYLLIVDIGPNLHFLHETKLIMIYHHLNVFLHIIYTNFLENFYIYVIMELFFSFWL